MANGIMVDAATYYKDTSTYTGESGSITNPYCVEDCFDFLKIDDYPTIAGAYSYFLFVADVDFNDHPTYKYGFESYGYVTRSSSVRILGNNKQLRNIIMKYTSSTFKLFEVDKINDLKIVNIINLASGCQVFYATHGFENCSISLYVNDPQTYDMICSIGGGGSLINCTLNIRGKIERSIVFPKLINCHINLDLISNYASQIFRNYYFDNCYITGKFKTLTTGTINIFANLRYETLKNCYMSLKGEFPNTNIVRINESTSYSATGVNFFDVTMCPVDANTLPQNVHALTTEQCKSYDYLSSIGFIVVPVGG